MYTQTHTYTLTQIAPTKKNRTKPIEGLCCFGAVEE